MSYTSMAFPEQITYFLATGGTARTQTGVLYPGIRDEV